MLTRKEIAEYLIQSTKDNSYIYRSAEVTTYRFKEITNLNMLYKTKDIALKYLEQLQKEEDGELKLYTVIIEVKQTNYEFSSNWLQESK